MATVSRITPEKRNFKIPEPLRQCEGWLVWRYEQHGNEAKPRKVPYYVTGNPRHGKQGSPEDRARLTSYAAALRHLLDGKGDGIGLAMLHDWGLTAIDIDNCVAEDGSVPEIVEHLAARTYVEYSPSKKGVRAFVRGNLGNHKSSSGPDGPYGLETFYSTGYVTITGNSLDTCQLLGTDETIADIDDYIVGICQRRFGSLENFEVDPDDPFVGLEPRLGLSVDEMQELLSRLDPDMGRDRWIRVGAALHHETEGDDTGFELWNDWSMGGAKYIGADDLRKDWDSFDRRAGTRRRNVTMATVKHMVNQSLASADDILGSIDHTAGGSSVATPVDYDGKYPVRPAAWMASQPPMDWIVKGVLPRADIGMIYGAPGSGKSFLAFDMAAAIARGIDWCGAKVKQGRVVILAAEGGGGYGKRVQAYCRQYDIDAASLDIGIINARPNIMEVDEVREIAKAIKASGGCAVLIMDTLAQVTPGANENSGEDMGRALAHARVLAEVTGAMVVLVHHSGKDQSKGSRGWSGMLGAVDVEIAVIRDEDRNYREFRVTKQKDGEDGLRHAFKLDVVTLGEDADGDKITSCVVVFTEVQKKASREPDKKIKRRGQWQRHILEVIEIVGKGRATMPKRELIEAALEMAPKKLGGETEPAEITRMELSITRAIDTMARESDGPIGLKDRNLVVLFD